MAKDRSGIRINLTLPPGLVSEIDRIAALTDSARATVIREWLVTATPGISEMADTLALAKTNQQKALQVLQETLIGASNDAHQLALDIKQTRRRLRRGERGPT